MEGDEIHRLIARNDPTDLLRLGSLLADNLPDSLVAQEYGRGEVPLCTAAWYGNLAAVDLLLRLGAVVDGLPGERTPLMCAAREKHPEVLERLLAGGALVNLGVDDYRWTALQQATWGGDARCVTILLDAGAEGPGRGEQGGRLLHLAAEQGDRSLFELLIERTESDVHALDRDGRTALEIAARYGNAAAIRALCAIGAEPAQGTVDRLSLLALLTIRGGRIAKGRVSLLLEELREVGFFDAPEQGPDTFHSSASSLTVRCPDGTRTLTMSEMVLHSSQPRTPTTQRLVDTWRMVRRIEADLLPDESALIGAFAHDYWGQLVPLERAKDD